MICHECKHDCPDGSNFCPKCGRNFKPKRSPRKEGSPVESAPAASNYPNPASLESYRAKRREVRNTALTAAAIVLACGLGYGFAKENGFLIIASPIIALFVYSAMGRFTASSYYAVDGARGQDGEHRCIFCGARGIYRKGEYRTDKKTASCAKCGTFLFQE